MNLKLRASGESFMLVMDEGAMSDLQTFLNCIRNGVMLQADKLFSEALNEYCWGWNKMFGKGEISPRLNATHHETFEEHLNAKLAYYYTGMVPMKCPVCKKSISTYLNARSIDENRPLTCPKCMNTGRIAQAVRDD